MYAIKVELKLNNKQKTWMAKHAGFSRVMYNYGLNLFWHSLALRASDSFRIQSINKCFTNVVKKQAELAWINQLSYKVYPSAFQDFQSAFYRRRKELAKKPSYKRRKDKQSFPVGDSKGQVLLKAGKTIKIPTLGTFRLQEPLTEGYDTQTLPVSCEAEKWFVSFSEDAGKIRPIELMVVEPVGIYLGVKQFATLSHGSEIKATKPLKKAIAKPRKYQYRNQNKPLRLELLAHASYGNIKTGHQRSNNAKKYFKRLARSRRKIAKQHGSFLKKTTTELCKKYAHICREDLNVKGMMANPNLAWAISDLGFYEFRGQLECKAPALGCQLEIVDRWYPSSKQCRMCFHINDGLQRKDRVFCCPSCGHKEQRDLDAAINLASAPDTR